MFEDDLDDYSDVSLITAMLIGTSKDATMKHAVRIQKMAFLVDKIMGQKDLDDEFDFGPDKFGPMSENVESSVDMLIEMGYAKQAGGSNKGASLTEEGSELVEAASERYPGVYELCRSLNSGLAELTDREIIKLVYRLYPEDTVNSLIRNELVKTQRVDSFAVGLEGNGTFKVVTENGVSLTVEVEDGVVRITEAVVDA